MELYKLMKTEYMDNGWTTPLKATRQDVDQWLKERGRVAVAPADVRSVLAVAAPRCLDEDEAWARLHQAAQEADG